MRTIVAAACAITLIELIVAPRALWQWNGGFPDMDPFMFRNGLAIGGATALAACLLAEGDVSRWVRLAVLLPMCHVAVMLIAWYEWRDLDLRSWIHDGADVPIGRPLATTIAVCAIVSMLIAPRRTSERLHTAVMLALSGLLLLGLWLPFAADAWARLPPWNEPPAPGTLAPQVLVPPFVAAVVFTALALRRPDWVRRARPVLGTGLLTLFLIGLAVRSEASPAAAIAYAHFAPIVGACALTVLIALAALAAQLVVRRYRDLRLLHAGRDAIVVDDDGAGLVASFEITSWLRGLRTHVRSFTAATTAGDLPVPSSARLAIAVPLLSTTLRSGDAVTVLARGDAVVLGGYVEQTVGDDPFRRADVVAPGPCGAVVGPAARLDSPLTEVALHIWRPCVAYLVIATAIALPALITAL